MTGYRWILLIGSLLFLGACAPEPQNIHFGDAVHHMIEVQTYAPGDVVPATEGDQAAGAMERYRARGGSANKEAPQAPQMEARP